MDTVELLLSRRSVVANNMVPPGPDREELRTILRIGARVPDHGKLAPWRFILFEGRVRHAFGEVLAAAFGEANAGARDSQLAFERSRFLRAPVVVAVVSKAAPHPKIPEWEQILSAGAVCQNMLVAAHALGYVGQWITEWYAYDDRVARALAIGANERIAGFLYFGSAAEPPAERDRPDLDGLVRRWTPAQ